MKKTLWGLILVVLVGGGVFAYMKLKSPSDLVTKAQPKPWVEVVSASVTETASGTAKILKTGDELETGVTVTTDAKGKANIYFPNGSVARLDASSSLVLQEVQASSTSWSVRLMLLSGKVWSKIGLVTNISTTWEVRTTNAVAVVRGSAFGMEYRNGVSRVLGAEHTIKVAALDPKTGDKLAESEVDVTETKFVEIRDDKFEAIKERKAKLETKEETKTIQNDTWFKENKRHDDEFQDKIDKAETRSRTGEDKDTNIDIDINLELKKEILNIPDDNEPAKESTPTETESEAKSDIPVSSRTTPKPLEIVLTADSDLNKLKEGGKVSFRAFLKMSDGTKKDITARSKWSALGGIGVVSSDGVLRAAIDPNLGDVPEAKGKVIAVWEENGVNLLGTSDLIEVFPNIPTPSEFDIPQG